jgi:ribonuclease-3
LGVLKSFFLKKKTPEDIGLIRFVIQSFGYRPKDLTLFRKALTHKSIVSNNDVEESNERLEFLGDAILDAVIAEYLYEKYPGEDEGYLTTLKSKIVNRKTLSDIGEKMGVRNYLNYSSARSINLLAIEGNALEALVGAVYLDAGYKQVRESVSKYVLRKFVDINKLLEEELDFKSRLIIWCQKKRLPLAFSLISETKDKGINKYTVEARINNDAYGKGVGGNKKEAEQNAAKETFKVLIEID